MTQHDMRVAEAIEALRQELFEAVSRGWTAPMRFVLSPVELTLEVGAERGADGKIGWHVLSVGGKAQSTTTQTLKLTLTPVWRKEDGELVSDFTIGGESSDSEIFGPDGPDELA
jgi:hypothetical protein